VYAAPISLGTVLRSERRCLFAHQTVTQRPAQSLLIGPMLLGWCYHLLKISAIYPRLSPSQEPIRLTNQIKWIDPTQPASFYQLWPTNDWISDPLTIFSTLFIDINRSRKKSQVRQRWNGTSSLDFKRYLACTTGTTRHTHSGWNAQCTPRHAFDYPPIGGGICN
jgi:hypothetical protein